MRAPSKKRRRNGRAAVCPRCRVRRDRAQGNVRRGRKVDMSICPRCQRVRQRSSIQRYR